MRAIKFRGKGIKSGQWFYGSVVPFGNSAYIFKMFRLLRMEHAEVDPDTVGQFTGLTDKNGKEIYEGDILLWTRKNVHIEGRPLQDFSDKCIVYYDSDKCAFKFRCELRYGACIGYLDFDDDRADESFVEVIGNIYNNPEMIEKGWQQ